MGVYRHQNTPYIRGDTVGGRGDFKGGRWGNPRSSGTRGPVGNKFWQWGRCSTWNIDK